MKTKTDLSYKVVDFKENTKEEILYTPRLNHAVIQYEEESWSAVKKEAKRYRHIFQEYGCTVVYERYWEDRTTKVRYRKRIPFEDGYTYCVELSVQREGETVWEDEAGEWKMKMALSVTKIRDKGRILRTEKDRARLIEKEDHAAEILRDCMEEWLGLLEEKAYEEKTRKWSGWDGRERSVMRHICKEKELRVLAVRYFDAKRWDKSIASERLRAVRIHGGSLETLDGIGKERELQYLELSWLEDLRDISALREVRQSLKKLVIQGCSEISDFSVLSELKNLQSLVLYGVQTLPSLKFLNELPNLRFLQLNMKVEDQDLMPCLGIPCTKFGYDVWIVDDKKVIGRMPRLTERLYPRLDLTDFGYFQVECLEGEYADQPVEPPITSLERNFRRAFLENHRRSAEESESNMKKRICI